MSPEQAAALFGECAPGVRIGGADSARRRRMARPAGGGQSATPDGSIPVSARCFWSESAS
ncbi:MAG: hypothetical protein MZV65_20195 [Chromatiales bacterium]|nr:hypothetical protein [Chromatiales bacterium]